MVTENQLKKEYMRKMKKSLLSAPSGNLTNNIIIKDKYGVISQPNPFLSQPRKLSNRSVKKLLYFLLRNHQNHKEYNYSSKVIKQSLDLNQVDQDEQFYIRDYHLIEHHNNLNQIKLKYNSKLIRKININMIGYLMAGTSKCTYIQLLNDDYQLYIGSYCLQKGWFKILYQIQEPLLGSLVKDFNFLISNDEQFTYVEGSIYFLQNFQKILAIDFAMIARFSDSSDFFISFGQDLVQIYDLSLQQLQYIIIIPGLIQNSQEYYVSINLNDQQLYIEDWRNSIILEIKYFIITPQVISEEQIKFWIEY